jgi:MFS family permease
MPFIRFMQRTFYSLENPRYRIMWFGTLFSFLGMQMQVLARGYLAFDLTGRNSALGGVMLAFGLPQLVLSMWGGVLADRPGRCCGSRRA